jgi:hypothetical protein
MHAGQKSSGPARLEDAGHRAEPFGIPNLANLFSVNPAAAVRANVVKAA